MPSIKTILIYGGLFLGGAFAQKKMNVLGYIPFLKDL